MVAGSATLPAGGLALNQTSFDSHGKSSGILIAAQKHMSC